MTVALAAIVRDETEVLERSLPSYLPLIDSWQIIDTGSTDGTPEMIEELLGHLPGQVHHREWVDYSTARNQLLDISVDTADWTLLVDADEELIAPVNFKEWLAADPDPSVQSWLVEFVDSGLRWSRPTLVRRGFPGRYVGKVHEYLCFRHLPYRPLKYVNIHHFGRRARDGKWEQYEALLLPDAEAGDPRAVFYLAETYRYWGREEKAIEWYQRRAAMEGWEEETWYAAYQAASLRGSVDELLAAHRQRPWRHEPLKAAARLIASEGHGSDVLFIEPS